MNLKNIFSFLLFLLTSQLTAMIDQSEKIKSHRVAPHKMTVTHTDSRSKERTIYHLEHQESIILDKNRHIAPEKFCVRIAALAEEYRIPFPIIPVTHPDNKNLLDISTVIKKQTIFFNKDYVNQENPQFLKFMVGHELAHRYLNTPKNQSAMNTNFNMYKNYRIISWYWAIFGIFNQLSNNIFIKHVLKGCDTILLGLLAYYTFAPQQSITICNQMELDCDETAVTIFGRNYKEKKAIAEEGIAYFEHLKNTQSFSNKLNAFFCKIINNFDSPHPSYDERIANLKKIILNAKKLKKIQKINYLKACE